MREMNIWGMRYLMVLADRGNHRARNVVLPRVSILAEAHECRLVDVVERSAAVARLRHGSTDELTEHRRVVRESSDVHSHGRLGPADDELKRLRLDDAIGHKRASHKLADPTAPRDAKKQEGGNIYRIKRGHCHDF